MFMIGLKVNPKLVCQLSRMRRIAYIFNFDYY